MSQLPATAIIVVYFGPLPRSFGAWLKSCSYNTSFTWLVFTDAEVNGFDPPHNVHFRRLTLPQFCAKMSEETGFTVSFGSAYKVCDFRPLFWILLRDEPQQYDFWGHCDLDMVFGNLAAFIQPAWYKDYDKIFSVGHLTLYRNSDIANLMYRRSHPELDWRTILSDRAHYGFDEHIGVNRIWELHGGRHYQNEQLIADVDPQLAAFELVVPAQNFRLQTFIFDRGKIFRGYYRHAEWCMEEFMYMHFQKRDLGLFELPAGVESFYITPRGFVERREDVPSMEKVQALNPVPRFSRPSELIYRMRRRTAARLRTLF